MNILLLKRGTLLHVIGQREKDSENLDNKKSEIDLSREPIRSNQSCALLPEKCTSFLSQYATLLLRRCISTFACIFNVILDASYRLHPLFIEI